VGPSNNMDINKAMPGLILECDIGNSRCKWRILDSQQQVLKRGAFFHLKGFSELPQMPVGSRVKVANVAAQVVAESCRQQLLELGLVPEFACTTGAAGGVVNTYQDITRLGVDRWLAAIAAFNHCLGPVLVIDVGSAINVELIGADGTHLGGFIAPGIELMKRALLADTGQVRFDDIAFSDQLAFGQSTVTAVSGGISAALVGISRVAIEQAGQQLGSDFTIFVSGGGGPDVIPHLSETVIDAPDLVMDGLRWLLP
jgi:type III pantothenate kinase